MSYLQRVQHEILARDMLFFGGIQATIFIVISAFWLAFTDPRHHDNNYFCYTPRLSVRKTSIVIG